jgi:hypothetical protein
VVLASAASNPHNRIDIFDKLFLLELAEKFNMEQLLKTLNSAYFLSLFLFDIFFHRSFKFPTAYFFKAIFTKVICDDLFIKFPSYQVYSQKLVFQDNLCNFINKLAYRF